MAQPVKIGLDYFPLNVDIFDNEKVMAISKEFGIKGEIVVIRLLCAIYRNGYFIEWNELQRNRLQMNMPGVSSELLDTIVQRLVRWEFFDRTLFYSTAQVLSSRSIQKRYFNAVRRRKTPAWLPYLLIDDGDSPMVSIADEPTGDSPEPGPSPAAQPRSRRPEQEEAWYRDIRADQLFLETVAMRFHLTLPEVRQGIDDLNLENIAKEKVHPDYTDYRHHVFEYMRRWAQNLNNANNNNNTSNNDNTRTQSAPKDRRRGIKATPAAPEDYQGTF